MAFLGGVGELANHVRVKILLTAMIGLVLYFATRALIEVSLQRKILLDTFMKMDNNEVAQRFLDDKNTVDFLFNTVSPLRFTPESQLKTWALLEFLLVSLVIWVYPYFAEKWPKK